MINFVEIPVFISHPFQDDIIGIKIEDYRKYVLKMFNSVRSKFNKQSNIKMQFKLYFEDYMYGTPLPGSIRTKLKQSYIVFADITGLRPNVFYEIGYAQSLKKELLIVKSSSEKTIPIDIIDLFIETYTVIDDLQSMLFHRLFLFMTDLARQIKLGTFREIELSSFWFDQSIKEVNIICSPEPEKSSFADLYHQDYLYIDNLEDRDCLLEVSNFLSRSFPKTRFIKHSSSNVCQDDLLGNLVLIGGPGFEVNEGNSVAREFINLSGLGINYLTDQNSALLRNRNGNSILKSVEYKEELLVRDVGYFAVIPNPLNHNCKVILCQGIHTFGTLGSFFAFSDNAIANINIKKLSGYLGKPIDQYTYFESILDVHILTSRRVVTPDVDLNSVVFL